MELQLIGKCRVALAVGTVVALGVLGACGTQHGVTEGASGSTVQTRDRALERLNSWWGSTTDEQAAEVVIAYRLNGPYDQCLELRGYPRLDWRQSILLVGGSYPLGATPWLIPSNIQPFSADLEVNAANAALESTLNNPPSRDEAEIRAEDTCIEETRSGQPSDDAVDDLRLPSGVGRLRDEWNKALLAAYQHLGSTESFIACVDDQKVAELRGTSLESSSHVAADVERELGIGQGALTSRKSGSFRAWEEPIAAAIWECVEPTYDEAVADLPGVLAEFEEQHAKEIAAAQQRWNDIRSEAQRLGWSPSEPRAGSRDR